MSETGSKAPTPKRAATKKTATKSTTARTTAKKAAGRTGPAAKASAEKGRLGRAETALDLPVGAVLTAADRVSDLVTPWTDRAGAEKKVRAYRGQLEKSLHKVEKRGASARSNATGRIRNLQGADRLKVLTDRAEKLQTELTRVLESQSARAQDLVGQVGEQISALR